MTTKCLAKFQSTRAITHPKIIGPDWNVNSICNSSLYTHIPKIKSISPSIVEKKWWQLNIWQNFKVQGPKIIGPERNVNLICNSSLYTHIPYIKSISQSTAKKSGRNCFYFGITDMVNTICPGHLVVGT